VVFSNVVSGNVGSPGDGNVEVALDIDMAVSMAPGLSTIYVYEAPNDTSYASVILNRMATNTLCRQLSSSWSGFSDSAVEQAFMEFAIQGQSFFESSGDSGAYFPSGNPVVPPCDDPNITIVGGTTLDTTGPKGNWVSETTWNWYSNPEFGENDNATSGGISPTYALPSWQQGINMTTNQGSTNNRNIPDVAMVGDGAFVIADDGVDYIAGGTSVAAPLWAGFAALINQQDAALGQPPAGFLNPALYAIGESTNYSLCFHDITQGNDTNFNDGGDNNTNNPSFTENFVNTNSFFAVPGYDLCSGWGTPIGSNLINVLAPPESLNIQPLTGFAATGTFGLPFAAMAQTYTLTNTAAFPIDWSVLDLPSWLAASSAGGVLPPGQSASVTISLNTFAATVLAAGAYAADVALVDTTDGITQIRPFSLNVGLLQLVQNGGFETGNFSRWSLTGPKNANKDNIVVNTNSSVFGGAPSATRAAYVFAGFYSALMGQSGADAYLTQSSATIPGQVYLISAWVANPGLLSGGNVTPNNLQLLWNGVTLYNQSNLGAFAWTNLQFIAAATGTNAVLQIGVRCDNDFIGLDSISVEAIPPPAFSQDVWTNQSLILTWTALAGRTYQLLYATNLPTTNWVNLGSYISATNGLIIGLDSLPSDPQRFYQVTLSP
jgi:hypothetical protein